MIFSERTENERDPLKNEEDKKRTKKEWKSPVKFCKIMLGDKPGHSTV